MISVNSQFLRAPGRTIRLSTKGKEWNTTEPKEDGYIRIRLGGSNSRYYACLQDLTGTEDRIQLYTRLYHLPPLIYIAGPYSAGTEAAIQENISRAARAGLDCCRAGWSTHIPHKNFAGFHAHQDVPYDAWLEKDLAILSRCDAILLLEGWASSKGAAREFQFAEEQGIPPFFSRDGIPRPDVIRRCGVA